MSRAFLCVSVDATADQGARREPRSPRSFLGVRDGLARRLFPLFAEHRAPPTVLLDEDVLTDPVSVEIVRAEAARCEIGVATSGRRGRASRDELRAVTDAFIRAFGHQPGAHRAAHVSRDTVAAAEDLGLTVDGSVTPLVDGTEAGLDLEGAPRQPYRADRGDPSRPGPSRVVEVPVTAGRTRRGLFGGRTAVALSPAAADGDTLIRLAEDAVAEARRARPGHPVILHGVVRVVDVVSGAGPDAADEAHAHTVLARLGALLSFARREDIAVVGLSEVPEIVRL